jgi:hypothetical protein
MDLNLRQMEEILFSSDKFDDEGKIDFFIDPKQDFTQRIKLPETSLVLIINIVKEKKELLKKREEEAGKKVLEKLQEARNQLAKEQLAEIERLKLAVEQQTVEHEAKMKQTKEEIEKAQNETKKLIELGKSLERQKKIQDQQHSNKKNYIEYPEDELDSDMVKLRNIFKASNHEDLISKLKAFKENIANKESTNKNKKNGKQKASIIPNTHILIHSPKGMYGSLAFNDCRPVAPGLLLSRDRLMLSMLPDAFACNQCNDLIKKSKINSSKFCHQKAALVYYHKPDNT